MSEDHRQLATRLAAAFLRRLAQELPLHADARRAGVGKTTFTCKVTFSPAEEEGLGEARMSFSQRIPVAKEPAVPVIVNAAGDLAIYAGAAGPQELPGEPSAPPPSQPSAAPPQVPVVPPPAPAASPLPSRPPQQIDPQMPERARPPQGPPPPGPDDPWPANVPRGARRAEEPGGPKTANELRRDARAAEAEDRPL